MISSDGETAPSAITYEGLPVGSGGAHGLGRLGSREAYTRTLDFIAAIATQTSPRTQHFSWANVPGMPEHPTWQSELRREFGDGSGHTIPVPDSQVESALQFLDAVNPQPENEWGMAPLSFVTVWRLAILHPGTGQPFPGQDPPRYPGLGFNNKVILNLSNRASIDIELCIADLSVDRLGELMPVLQSRAPFKFSSKHWRRWTVTKNGSFTSRKIDPFLAVGFSGS